MHPLCSINTRMAAMNSGVVRLSMIAAMVTLATFGTTIALWIAVVDQTGRHAQ